MNWIKVTQAHPPHSKWLALYCPEDDVYDPGMVHRFWSDSDIKWCIKNWYITHWIELPEVPEVLE